MAAVIVACVGFVVLLVALGVARIRNAKRHSGAAGEVPGVAVDDRQEMEWDNSALTITVNPMDQEVGEMYFCDALLQCDVVASVIRRILSLVVTRLRCLSQGGHRTWKTLKSGKFQGKKLCQGNHGIVREF